MRIDTSLDRLFLGYRRISFCREDMGKVVAALLRSGLGAAIDGGSSISVPLRRVKHYCNALSEIDISVGEICGLPGAIGALTARRWLLAGILISTLFYLFSFSFVWDVRISGNEEYSDSDVLSELEAVGLYSGASWYSLSRDEVENRLLETSDNIGWINVNRRGAVAYVRVREKHLPSDVIDAGGYSNIVASEACVIEQITVRSGVAAVEVGDTVKAGDILISGIVSTFAVKAEQGGGAIVSFLDAPDPFVYVDEMHSTNVVFNLMDNALKYKKPDIPVQLEVRTWNSGGKFYLSVKDNGIGIPKEHLKKIFERFYRVSGGNVHDVKGFGLGLAYVRQVVRAHGGIIKAESEPGEGTTFVIVLPLK